MGLSAALPGAIGPVESAIYSRPAKIKSIAQEESSWQLQPAAKRW